ncbi:MAG TPA: hypothetical protein VF575_05270 [Candidatus Saccharimonadales bacterium]|jgi:hypothetical protein
MVKFEGDDELQTQPGSMSGGVNTSEEDLPEITSGERPFYAGRQSSEPIPGIHTEINEDDQSDMSAEAGDMAHTNLSGWERDPTKLSQLPREDVPEALGSLVVPIPDPVVPVKPGSDNFLP